MDTIDTTVEKLVARIHENHPEGITRDALNATIEELRRRMETKEDVLTRRKNLELLFDTQIERLQHLGVPEQIVEELRKHRGRVLHKAMGMTIDDLHIPFVPIIPLRYIGYHGLMSLVRNGEETGYIPHAVDISKVEDLIKTPNAPYYIYNAGCSIDMSERSETVIRETLETQGRSPFTAVEAICFSIVSSALVQYGVWAFGSYYDHYSISSLCPIPCIFFQNKRLIFSWSQHSYPYSFCVPSCGSRGNELSCLTNS
jgi:hypothetical protein